EGRLPKAPVAVGMRPARRRPAGPRCFGGVHRPVGGLDRTTERSLANGIEAEADRQERAGRRRPLDLERLADAPRHGVGEHLVHRWNENRELVSSEPRNDVLGAEAPAEEIGGAAKKIVPSAVAESVVDLLEIVDVAHEARDRVEAARFEALDLDLEIRPAVE